MKPIIPNIIFKSALWLRQNDMDYEAKYLVQYYMLTERQQQIFNMINDKQIFGVVEGKMEGNHG
jgi:hypothetical protein